MEHRSRRTAVRATAIFVVAWTVRLYFLAGIEAYPKFELIRDPFNDQTLFDLWAQAAAGGERFVYPTLDVDEVHWSTLDPGVYTQSPLYPLALAAFYRVAGVQYDLVRVVQTFLGAVGCALLYLLARRYVSEGWSLSCGLGLAVYGPLVFYEAALLRVGPLTFVAVLALLLLDRAARSPGAARDLAAGLVLGVLVLLRPNLVVFAVLALLWLAWSRSAAGGGPRRGWIAGVRVAGTLALALSPVIAVNTARSGHLAFLSANGPYNLFIANVHDASGIEPLPSPYYHQVTRSRPVGEIDLVAETLADVRRHPGAFLKIQWRKLRALVSGWEIPNNVSYAMGRETNPRLRVAFVEYFMVLPLALCGVALALARKARIRRFGLPLLFLGSYLAAFLPFVVISRLRVPLVPVLLLFAAFAAETLASWWRRGDRRRALAVLAVAAAGVAGLGPPANAVRWVDYVMAGNAYFRRGLELEELGRRREASEAYRRAVVLNPGHAQALDRLRPSVANGHGVAADLRADARRHAEAGEPRRAMAALERAVARDPFDDDARRELLRWRFELQARPWR